MDKEDHAFYVVRKGNIVSIYRSLSDCQAQVSTSVCDPPVAVYKGYFLSKKTVDYLSSHGLRNASYTINEADVNEDLFGALAPCPLLGATSSASVSTGGAQRPLNLGLTMDAQPVSYGPIQCSLEFDGAAKGNPGKAGAGAVIRIGDGHVHCVLREGLGVVTKNVAEYRGLILGMRYALKNGFKQIRVTGDSQLVCMQVQGIWQTKHQNMIELCKEVNELKSRFLSFQISHVRKIITAMSEEVILEYDGASKGNPGRGGAGAVLKYEDGTVIARVREGLGDGTTNNAAEYAALIRGMKTALDMGFDRILIRGDSKLVHQQVLGRWQARNPNMSMYCREAQYLKGQFKSCYMELVPRGYNTDADAEANRAVNLPAGHVEEEGGSSSCSEEEGGSRSDDGSGSSSEEGGSGSEEEGGSGSYSEDGGSGSEEEGGSGSYSEDGGSYSEDGGSWSD